MKKIILWAIILLTSCQVFGKWGNIDSLNVMSKLRLKNKWNSNLLYVNIAADSMVDTTGITITPYTWISYFPNDIYLTKAVSSGIWNYSNTNIYFGAPNPDSSAYLSIYGSNASGHPGDFVISTDYTGVGRYGAVTHGFQYPGDDLDSLRFIIGQIPGGGIEIGGASTPYGNYPVRLRSPAGDDWYIEFKGDSSTVTAKTNFTAGVKFGDSGSIDWYHYFPDTAIVEYGDDDGDDWHDIDSCQNGLYTIEETATTPGISVVVSFNGVSTFNWMRVHAGYSGSTSHGISIQAYNWDNTSWESFGSIQHGYVDTTTGQRTLSGTSILCPGRDRYISASDSVKIRLYHGASGVASHRLYIDMVGLFR